MSNLRASWIALGAFVALEAAGATVSFPKQKVHVDALPVKGIAHHGYTPHRFEIHNSSTKKKKVTLTLPSQTGGDAYSIEKLTRSVVVSPNTSLKVLLLQPPLGIGYSAGTEVRVRVGDETRNLASGFHSRMDSRANVGLGRERIVLLSRSMDQKEFEDETRKMGSLPSRGGHSPGHGPFGGPPPSAGTELAVFETAATNLGGWNTHWLAYSSYDAIVLTDVEWASAPRNVREAIERWALSGGRLYVLGGEIAEAKRWPSKGLPRGRGTMHQFGMGQCVVLGEENESTRRAVMQDLERVMHPTSGHGLAGSIPMLAGLQAGVELMHGDDHHYYHPFMDSEQDFNTYFSVVTSSRVPVRLVVGVLTIFVILAGPVTLILLARKGKRVWFLWTLPALALAVSVAVFAVSFLSEGITPHVRLAGVTILDQSAGEATTIGGIGIYAPIAPGELAFDGSTEVTPLHDAHPNVDDPGGSRTVTWTDGGRQKLEGDWVPSRVTSHFAIRKSEARKERLEVNRLPSGELEVLNALGANLKRLLVCGEDGEVFQGENILAGKRVTLQRETAGRAYGQFDGLAELIESTLDLHAGHGSLMKSIRANQMMPGIYWAELEGSVFLENPLGERNVNLRTESHVIGILPTANPGGPGR